MVWNVSLKWGGSIHEYQFEGDNILYVYNQATHLLVGEIIKIALAKYEED
ncbi:hypothetical protein P4U90_20845 [Cytobacillus kochii]|nr:hypothetical protein [Cytobacillus kochii]